MIILLILGLIYASYTDLKDYKVPLYLSLSLISVRFCYLIYKWITTGINNVWFYFLAGAVMFIVFAVSMRLFKTGGADTLMALLIGLMFGVAGFGIVCAALIFAFILMLIINRKERKSPYPLVPFMTAAVIVFVILNIFFRWAEVDWLI